MTPQKTQPESMEKRFTKLFHRLGEVSWLGKPLKDELLDFISSETTSAGEIGYEQGAKEILQDLLARANEGEYEDLRREVELLAKERGIALLTSLT